jgi:hypothetical protein
MSTCVRELTAAELKNTDRRRFDREYSKWSEWQWQDDWYVENTHERFKEKYKPKGFEIEQLHYRISYSQGDFASFSGRVFLAEWMEATLTCKDGPSYAERYPALYIACSEDGSYMNITGEDDRRGGRVDFQEGWYHVGPSGIFSQMSDEDWEELVSDQASEADLEAEIIAYCQCIGREIYDELRDSYEDATSEESFIESCEANDVTFEVEEIQDEVCC